MARLCTLIASLALALLALAASPSMRAQHVLGRALEGLPSIRGQQLAGGLTWLEQDGIAVALAPAPSAASRASGHVLVAGEGAGARAAALYRLNSDDASLRSALSKKGAAFGTASAFSFRDRGQSQFAGVSTAFALADGSPGLLTTLDLFGRAYALVLTAPSAATDLAARRGEILSEIFVMPGMKAGVCAPLLGDGRFACRLAAFRREGEVFVRRLPRGVMYATFFALPAADFADTDALQREVEERLRRQDIRRTRGSRVLAAQQPGFLAEYFHVGGTDVLRVLYAVLGDAGIVAVLSGPDSVLEELRVEGENLAASIIALPFGAAGGGELPISAARAVRLAAWQEGDKLFWGALFDAVDGGPLLWREPGVRYAIRLVIEGREGADNQSKIVQSSRELNPLVGAAERTFSLPNGGRGPATLELTIGELRTSLKLELQP